MKKNKPGLIDHFDPRLKRIVLKLLKDEEEFESVSEVRKSLLKEILLPNSDITSPREIYYDEDELIQSHWLRIAGLEEEK
jgi:hypothetical protein